jgi:hypothetical protein
MAEITRTPSSNGNQKTWTWSAWIKKATVGMGSGDYQMLFEGNIGSGSRYTNINFREDYLEVFGGLYSTSETSVNLNVSTNRVFRDPSSFYHLLVAVDTTQSTEADRVKIYVNGVQETSVKNYQGSSAVYPAQNTNTFMNVTTAQNRIGASSGSYLFKGLMTHVHFVDGTAYDASTFGETDATTGIWKPIIEPSVTYGTNGFFLKFNEGALGTDSSPNGNNFTVSGSLTPAKDTPDNVFTTWNPLENYYQSATLSNGNTTIQTGSSQYSPSSSTLGVSSGKWYWEVEYDALSGGSDVAYVGVLSQFATNSTTSLGTNANDYGYYVNGNYYNNNTGTAYGTTYTTGDIIGVALDLDNNKLYFSKNGTWQNSGDPESGATGTGAISITNPASTTNGAYFASICDGSSSANATFKTNFGNGYFGTTPVASAGSNGNGAIFEYNVPTGYYALNTKNINTYG